MDKAVQYLMAKAHAQAVHSGFWETNNAGEKFSLICTEIEEQDQAYGQDAPDEERLEELADIVIRALDLAGYIGLTWEPFSPLLFNQEDLTHERMTLTMYTLVARACQHHRKHRDVEATGCLRDLVSTCSMYADYNFGPGQLMPAVYNKMEKNARRPRKHGARY